MASCMRGGWLERITKRSIPGILKLVSWYWDISFLTRLKRKASSPPNWQGPFVVKKLLPNRALYLTDIEGKMAEMAINADAVKRYYVWYLILCWFYCTFSTCIFEDWYDEGILFFYPNIVSSFVYPFELRFNFLSYPSFGIKMESKINVEEIRTKERIQKFKKKSKLNQNKEQADGTTSDLILLSREWDT